MIKIKNNFSLKRYNSLLIDKKANYFCELQSIDDCEEAIKFSISKNLDILILGSGTNILLTNDFDHNPDRERCLDAGQYAWPSRVRALNLLRNGCTGRKFGL